MSEEPTYTHRRRSDGARARLVCDDRQRGETAEPGCVVLVERGTKDEAVHLVIRQAWDEDYVEAAEYREPCEFCDGVIFTCGERSPDGWGCTRHRGHAGPHVACSGDRHVIAGWE